MNSNYYSALKISLLFLIVSSFYIVFSDKIILQIVGSSASVEVINKIQSYKGLGFVFLTSILLFVLIQREIASKMKYIKKLEKQKKELKDVSEAKEKVSKELAERNRYIQTILNNIPLGVAVNNLDEGNATYINKQFAEIYGWPKDELANVDTFFNNAYPDNQYREKIQERILRDIKSGDAKRMKWDNIEITTQTGEKRIINAQNFPLAEQNLMISTVQDVTEKVELQKERDRIFENSVDMVCTATMDGYLQQLNPAWEKVLGWTSEELRSKPFLEFIHPDDLPSSFDATKNLAKGEPALGFENRYLTKDGGYRWLSWNTIPFPEENMMMGIARDITEEVDTLNQLEFQKNLNKSVFDTAEVGLCIINEEGYFTKVNDAYSRIYGYSRDELIGERLTLLIPPEQRNAALEVNRKMMSGDLTMAPRTWEVINKKGEKLDVLVSAKVFEVKNEKYQITSVLDVTQMKSVQRELERSKEQLKNITDNLPGAVIQYKLNPDGTDELTYVSEGAYSILGVSADEAQKDNQQIWTQIDKRDIGEVKKSIEYSYKNLTPWTTEYRNKLPDGSVKWIEGTGLPKKQEDGSVIWDSIMLDITTRKEAEEEVQESKTLLEKTVNSLNEAVLVINPETRKITLANAAVENIFGYKVPEILGKNTEFLHLTPEMYKKFAMLSDPKLDKHGIFHVEFQMKRKDGSIINTENTVTSIRDDNKGWESGVVSVIRDVTERKRTEKRLQEYQESLKQLTTEISIVEEKQRKEFAANIHDHLSQLLVISQMKMNDLKNQLQTDDKKRQVEVISKHIAEALENSRKITYDLSPPVLYELGLVETMYWFTDKINEEQDIQAKFTTEVESLSLSESKLILVFRVIQELVNNTLKHAEANFVEVKFTEEANLLEITVRDDGKGFVADAPLNTKFKEGGFGLFAVKERVSNLGGDFSVRSKPGFGTSISISLPLSNDNSEE